MNLKWLVAMMIGLSTVVNAAPKANALVGSFKGDIRVCDSSSETAHLMLRPIEGRDGAYLGVLIYSKSVKVYRIDPLTDTSFAMNLVNLMEDGEIGVPNDEPVQVMNLTPADDGIMNISLTNAVQSQCGLTGLFEGDSKSKYAWMDLVPGEYSKDGDSLSLSPKVRFTATASSRTLGNYIFQEKVEGLFSIRPISVTSTGTRIDSQSASMAIFVKKAGMIWDDLYLLIILADGTVQQFKI